MASEYLRRQAQQSAENRQPETPLTLTPAQRRRDWWHYHWIQTTAAAVVLALLCSGVVQLLRLRRPAPDYHVAYVGTSVLPDDTVRALETAFAALGEDLDGNGRVVVRLNQYLYSSGDTQVDTASQQLLTEDLADCESYFFLLQDPTRFQQQWRVLGRLDGSLPSDAGQPLDDTLSSDGALQVDGLCLAWGQCPVLAAMRLGDYSYKVMGQPVSGSSDVLVAGLYLARRGFQTGETCAYPDGCAALWEKLTAGATVETPAA